MIKFEVGDTYYDRADEFEVVDIDGAVTVEWTNGSPSRLSYPDSYLSLLVERFEMKKESA